MMRESVYKLGSWSHGPPTGPDQEHTYNRLFTVEQTTGPERLKIGADCDAVRLLVDLVSCMQQPLRVLYVLHVSRTDAEPARYESPPVTYEELVQFTSSFCEFFQRDARQDLWVGSRDTSDLLVLDRHALLYAYGPLERYADVLHEAGYKEGTIEIPVPHTHPKFDSDEEQVLQYFTWIKSPLRGDQG
jgi:hypothetical protein